MGTRRYRQWIPSGFRGRSEPNNRMEALRREGGRWKRNRSSSSCGLPKRRRNFGVSHLSNGVALPTELDGYAGVPSFRSRFDGHCGCGNCRRCPGNNPEAMVSKIADMTSFATTTDYELIRSILTDERAY